MRGRGFALVIAVLALPLLALLLLMPVTVRAQDRATLVADAVTVQSQTVLLAQGHVEVFFRGQHMTASAITYDSAADRLTITGPIRIDDGKGNLFLAEQADLKADLTEGLMTSARIVLADTLQLAAAQVLRTQGGRVTAMRRVAASSCTICAGSSTPLWEIRAREVVHDALAQQIWFSDATLRFAGVPVLYLPVLRVPDPTLTRATGFLIPRMRTTTAQGTGLYLPYFITLGASRDLTLTPYLTSAGDRTLNLRYRQAFDAGTLTLSGALTNDHILPGTARGYLEADGAFDLGRGYKLALHGIVVSDDAYLLDYGISSADRLDSTLDVTRVQRNLYFQGRLTGLQTLREGDSNATQPALITDIVFHRRFLPAILGGEGEFEIQSHSQYRPSSDVTDASGDGIADGRDVSRLSFKGVWRRNWTLPNGIELSTGADAEADFYTIGQDAVYAGHPYRGTATAGVELRWPWVATNARGVSQLIEPVVQLVASPKPDSRIPNEDSTLVEFDESNLFALDRFPGADAFEAGTRLNLGLNYLRSDPAGWTLGLAAGRVLRQSDLGQFSAASGLGGRTSDWLVAASLAGAGGLSMTTRLVLDDGFGLTKGEMRFDLARPGLTGPGLTGPGSNGRGLRLSGGYMHLLADASENRADPVREIVLDASYDLTRNWTARLTDRYDLVANSVANAGLKLTYRNECLLVDLSVSRRYTSSTSVAPSTDFGLSVELLGFGGSTQAGTRQVCRN